MKNLPEDDQEVKLPTIDMRPNKSTKTERVWWKKFLEFLIPRLSKQEKLGLRVENAKIGIEEAEHEKRIQEAANLAADLEKKKIENLSAKFELIDTHLKGLSPEERNNLKLASLMDKFPCILKQCERVMTLKSRLEAKECILEFSNGKRIQEEIIDAEWEKDEDEYEI